MSKLSKHENLLAAWMELCIGNDELIKQFDRLRGTNVGGKGTPIDFAIDRATGKFQDDANKYLEFCFEMFVRFVQGQERGVGNVFECLYCDAVLRREEWEPSNSALYLRRIGEHLRTHDVNLGTQTGAWPDQIVVAERLNEATEYAEENNFGNWAYVGSEVSACQLRPKPDCKIVLLPSYLHIKNYRNILKRFEGRVNFA